MACEPDCLVRSLERYHIDADQVLQQTIAVEEEVMKVEARFQPLR